MSRQVDPSTIVVNRFVAHQVPRLKGEDDERPIRYSVSVPDLPPDTLEFFAGRLKVTLLDSGQNVEIDESLESPQMPAHVESFLASDETDLLEVSMHAAQLLLEAQPATRWEDESILAVMDVTVDGQPGVAIAKLEQEEGVEFEEAKVDGGTTLVVSINDHLLLTENTRLFKAGVYRMEDGAPVGVVCDIQQGERTTLARYFLRDFLGSRHQISPARTTKAFVAVVERYVSEKVADPEQKLQIDAALRAELASARPKIAPSKFIQVHVPEEHRGGMHQAITEAGLPTASFDKDTALVERRQKRTSYTTASGIKLSGPAEAMAERVETGEDEKGPYLIIRDRLTRVG